MTNVLIADDDLDSHELIDDLIEINFRDVTIEHALTVETFLTKIASPPIRFNLILFNLDLMKPGELDILGRIKSDQPDLFRRMVFLASGPEMELAPAAENPVLKRPFSLDEFGEVVIKACVD